MRRKTFSYILGSSLWITPSSVTEKAMTISQKTWLATYVKENEKRKAHIEAHHVCSKKTISCASENGVKLAHIHSRQLGVKNEESRVAS